MNFLDNIVYKYADLFRYIFSLVLSLLLIGIGLRIYEFGLVSANFLLHPNAGQLYSYAIIYDILYYSLIGCLFSALFTLLYFFNRKFALITTFLIISLFLIINVSLIQYFAEVLTPLGADFYAYNFTEINDTFQTSINLSVTRVLPIILFPFLFFISFYLINKIEWSPKIPVLGTFLFLMLAFLNLFLFPKDADYQNEIDYSLSVNKFGFFLNKSIDYLLLSGTSYSFDGPEYPLLKTSDSEDLLSPYFIKSERPPNLVFIIIESMGGTLLSPHDKYGGFAPFLESLARESLYWTHFLATSGRSFNAQASIFGSLPYGESGFMEMGYFAPEHHTLISILNDNGYQTNYFSGYDTRFDKLDIFLERQELDLLINSSRFPENYVKMDEIEGGFTWGYSDKDTYRRAFDFIDTFDHNQPRLDVFFSLNFHEPFIIPQADLYLQKFTDRLNSLDISEAKRNEYLRYPELFSALLYTDDAIKELIDRYRMRDDFEDTIFIITGDHRMIPVPHINRIDRYYVPFMIYSPKLTGPASFDGVSSHLDITPSLLSYLQNNYLIQTPDSVHWIGESLSMSGTFSSDKDIPFMRTKSGMGDYLSGDIFLSGDQIFQLEEGMLLRPLDNPVLLAQMRNKFNDFRSLNKYVTSENKLITVSDESLIDREIAQQEEEYFRRNKLLNLNNEELFFMARDKAFDGDYEISRTILKRILRDSPNFYDAWLLNGRTYAWESQYNTAMNSYMEVMRRNPELLETYEAIADLYFWQNNPDSGIEITETGLAINDNHIPLIFRRARAYNQAGNTDETRLWIEKGLDLEPENENLLNLSNQLN